MKLPDLLSALSLREEFERLRGMVTARHIAVAGARGGEGVSTVAASLAISLAGQGRVLLAEGNLRRPSLSRDLGLGGPGLLDWNLQEALPAQPMPDHPEVWVMTAGRGATPANSASLAARLTAAAQRAQQEFDYVIWDTSALSAWPDLLSIAPHCAGVLVVVEMDKSRADDLQFVRDTLERAQVPILGCLLNRSGRYWPRRPRRRMPLMQVPR